MILKMQERNKNKEVLFLKKTSKHISISIKNVDFLKLDCTSNILNIKKVCFLFENTIDSIIYDNQDIKLCIQTNRRIKNEIRQTE